MRNTGTAASSATAAPRHLAHQFVQCYSWPACGLKLLREHPHILSSQTRRLLERDPAWLLFPTASGGGPGPGAGATNQQHRDRAFGLISAAARATSCGSASLPWPARARRRAGSTGHGRRPSTCASAAGGTRTSGRAGERLRRRGGMDGAGGGGGRGIRVKFRRGNVALNYAQRDLDRARLAHMSFDELCEALRGRTLEEREALDQITQVRPKTLPEMIWKQKNPLLIVFVLHSLVERFESSGSDSTQRLRSGRL